MQYGFYRNLAAVWTEFRYNSYLAEQKCSFVSRFVFFEPRRFPWLFKSQNRSVCKDLFLPWLETHYWLNLPAIQKYAVDWSYPYSLGYAGKVNCGSPWRCSFGLLTNIFPPQVWTEHKYSLEAKNQSLLKIVLSFCGWAQKLCLPLPCK